MKAEHRKELQTNLLADRLGRFLQGLRGGWNIKPSTKALTIWGIIILAAALLIGGYVYKSVSAKNRSAEWLQIDEATSLDDLVKIADQDASRQPTRIARFQIARVYLRRGMEHFCSTAPQGRKDALHDLEQAAALYEKLAAESKDNPILVQEALMGVAKAKEALNELDAARDAYEKLVNSYPKSVNGKEAAERLKKLTDDKGQVGAFYNKLNELAAPPTAKKE